MSELIRFGVAIEQPLLESFDAYIERHQYPSRSEAIRDLIRLALREDQAPVAGEEVVGTVTLVYSHGTRQLDERMNALQHAYHHAVVSALHVHLDADACLEVIVLRGRMEDVRIVADGLISMKGVRHGQLVLAPASR